MEARFRETGIDMTVTDLGIAGRRDTGDARLDELLQRADAALRSALRAQRGRLDNKDLIEARMNVDWSDSTEASTPWGRIFCS